KAIQFSIGYEQNAESGRADLVIRGAVANAAEMKTAFDLIGQITHFSNLDMRSVDRLRDLAAQRLPVDEAFERDEFRSMQNAAYSFLTQQNVLFQAVNTAVTRTHWDERLKWRLHETVDPAEIASLGAFAEKMLADPARISASAIAQELKNSTLSNLEK